jgi:hypothetical protein
MHITANILGFGFLLCSTIGICMVLSKDINPILGGIIIGIGCSMIYFGGIIVGFKDKSKRKSKVES